MLGNIRIMIRINNRRLRPVRRRQNRLLRFGGSGLRRNGIRIDFRPHPRGGDLAGW